MRQKDNHGIWNERNTQKSENGRIRKGTTTDVIKRKKINVCGLRSKRKKKKTFWKKNIDFAETLSSTLHQYTKQRKIKCYEKNIYSKSPLSDIVY